MRLVEKFSIFGLLVVLSAIQFQPVESGATLIKDIGSAIVDYGVTFAPKPAQNLLKCVLKSAAIGMDATLQEAMKENTDILLNHFDEKINGLQELLKNQSDSVMAELDGIQLDAKRNKLDEMIQELDKFTEYYNFQFVKCVEKQECDESTIKSYSNYWLDPHSLHRSNLFSFVTRYVKHPSTYSKDDRIFQILLKMAGRDHAGRRLTWTHHESVQNTIYTFYKYISGSLSRMYRVTLYFLVKRYHEKSSSNRSGSLAEIENLLNKFRTDIKDIWLAAKESLPQASRYIFPDDPSSYVIGKNYGRLNQFMVAYLRVNQVANDEYRNWLKSVMKVPHYHAMMRSELKNCTSNYFHIVSKMWIDPNDNDRFYHHIEAEKENLPRRIYGDEKKSSGNLVSIDLEKVKFDPRLRSSGPLRSDLCYMFYNHHDITSVRKFSNVAVTASPGYVVTGIRWFIYKGIIYLQIQEGELVRGTIKPDTVKWKPVSTNAEEYIVLDTHKRLFNLDDVYLPSGHFLTGAQFFMTENSLSLRAIGMQITDDGQLIPSLISDYASYTLEAEREEILLDKPDISINAPHDHQHSMQGTPGKHYVKFQVTDLEKDAGQTTIPFLDTQAVVTNPPTPLGGIGTYYKGMPGFGGFLGLKLISVDILPILSNMKIDDNFLEFERLIEEEKNQLSR